MTSIEKLIENYKLSLGFTQGDAVAMTTKLMQPEGVQCCGVWMAVGMNSRYVYWATAGQYLVKNMSVTILPDLVMGVKMYQPARCMSYWHRFLTLDGGGICSNEGMEDGRHRTPNDRKNKTEVDRYYTKT